jgi:hypothetical protein
MIGPALAIILMIDLNEVREDELPKILCAIINGMSSGDTGVQYVTKLVLNYVKSWNPDALLQILPRLTRLLR